MRLLTLEPSGPHTTTGQGASVAVGRTDGAAIRAQLNVTAISGTPNVVVTIQDSLDGTNWNDLSPAFAAKTGVSREVINVTTPFGPYLRASWVISGGTPSATFDVVCRLIGE